MNYTSAERGIPDILDTIAQLSNDEVPTPPSLANAMLDVLPSSVWATPEFKFLDPGAKSGVFLREIARRLYFGLRDWEPDDEKRRDHIFRNMVYGCSITDLTALVSRRSLYYSRDASSEDSVVRFDRPDGNVYFTRTSHQFPRRVAKEGDEPKCQICGAPESIERGAAFDNHAYPFIHGAYPTKDLLSMKFDVIVSNPPFQLKDGGHGESATPLYQHFVENALDLEPRYVLFITPSRWFAGGKGLDKYRARLLSDRRIRTLVDYPRLYDAFPGVKIRGGVSYFLWDRDYSGPCTIQTMWNGEPLGESASRYLDAFDVLVRRNEAVSILEKIRGRNEKTLDARVSTGKPFGFRTYFHGLDNPDGLADPIKLYGSKKISWVDRDEIKQNREWIGQWKVLMTAVQGTSAAVETKFLSKPIVAGPDTACTETYLVAGRFGSQPEAEVYAAYLRTRFVRFLVSLRKATQHATRDVYAFVPDLRFKSAPTDKLLYRRYGLTADEIGFLESQVAEHSDDVG